MLRGDPRRGAVGPPKDDRAAHLAAGHVEGLGGGVDELVHRLHGEIEGHELDDRPQTAEGGTDAKPGEAVLGNRGVDHAPLAEFVEQTLADLVRTLILRDLLAHQERSEEQTSEIQSLMSNSYDVFCLKK